jgi:hypothetical protein
MRSINEFIEWRSLDSKRYNPDDIQRWKNAESYPYLGGNPDLIYPGEQLVIPY